MPTYQLAIDGSPVSVRSYSGQFMRLTLDREEPDTLECTLRAFDLPVPWTTGQAMTMTLDTIPRFLGRIETVQVRRSQYGWEAGITCQGVKGRNLGIVNPATGAGRMTFNIPITDRFYYLPATSGLSIGEILGQILDAHATQLATLGVAGYVAADLTGLTWTPPQPITVAGHLFAALDSLLDAWAGAYCCRIVWTPTNPEVPTVGDWRVRFQDTTVFTPVTLTMDVDPVGKPAVSRTLRGVATRVQLLGQEQVESSIRSIEDGTLVEDYDSDDINDWTWAAYAEPVGYTSYGAVSSLTSTGATLNPDLAAEAWIVNQWSQNEGRIWLINPVAVGILQQEEASITSSNALTAGGTAAVTWDPALTNGGYSRYRMIARGSGGLSKTYRRYLIRDASTGDTGSDTYVGSHLVPSFPKGAPFGTQMTTSFVYFPVGVICNGLVEVPADVEVNPLDGSVTFLEPTVKHILPQNSQTVLNAGGTGVTEPTDIRVIVAYSRGALSVAYPPDVDGEPQYAGTAYDEDGLQETWVIPMDQWIDPAESNNMTMLAEMWHETVRDARISFSCPYFGKYSEALGLGLAIAFARPGDGAETGWETPVPLRSVVLELNSGRGSTWLTHLVGDNTRRAATGAAMYLHPGFQGGAAWEQNDPFGVMDVGSLGFLGILDQQGLLGSTESNRFDDFGISRSQARMPFAGQAPTVRQRDASLGQMREQRRQANEAMAPRTRTDEGVSQVQQRRNQERAAINAQFQPEKTMRQREAPRPFVGPLPEAAHKSPMRMATEKAPPSALRGPGDQIVGPLPEAAHKSPMRMATEKAPPSALRGPSDQIVGPPAPSKAMQARQNNVIDTNRLPGIDDDRLARGRR